MFVKGCYLFDVGVIFVYMWQRQYEWSGQKHDRVITASRCRFMHSIPSSARRAVEVEIKANARCGSSHYSCAWNDYIETVPLFFSWQALWKFWLYLIFRYLRKSSAEFFHKIVLYVRYLWIFEALAKRFTPFYHREKCNFLLLSQQ